MAYEIPGFQITLEAGGDLSSSQYKFVKLANTGKVVAIAANTDVPFGVLQNAPASGQAATVMVMGVTKVQGNSNLAKADTIGTSADGQAEVYAAGTDTTKYICGLVLQDNSAAGGLCTALINCGAAPRGA